LILLLIGFVLFIFSMFNAHPMTTVSLFLSMFVFYRMLIRTEKIEKGQSGSRTNLIQKHPLIFQKFIPATLVLLGGISMYLVSGQFITSIEGSWVEQVFSLAAGLILIYCIYLLLFQKHGLIINKQ